MNNLKRILFVVAIVAVIASCLAFAVSAEYTVDNYDSILEYYEPVFGYEDFDDVDVGAYTDGIINEWSAKQLTNIVADGDNKYLSFVAANLPVYTSNLFLNMNAEESSRMLLSFKVRGEQVEGSDALPIVSVYVGNEQIDLADVADSHNEGLCFLKLDFNTGEVKYYTNRLKDYIVVEGFTLAADTWYNVDVIYNVVDNGYSVSVANAEDDTDSMLMQDIRTPMGYGTFENVRIGMSIDDILGSAQGSSFSLDDVFAYSGTYYRNPSDKATSTEAAFADFIKIVENDDVDSDTKIAVLEVYKQIIDEFGFTTESDAVQADIDTLRDYTAMLYVNYVAECTDSIDADGEYATRKANLELVERFYEAIPEDYSFLSAADALRLVSVKEDYEAELAYFAKVEADCETFLSVFRNSNLTSDEAYEVYSNIAPVYDATNELAFIDFTYPDMSQYLDSYKMVYTMYDKITVAGEDFVKNITEYQNAQSFADKYSYYRSAADIKANYINDTYPGVADALVIFNDFVENTDILLFEADCKSFIESVNRSDYALYLSEKQKNLNSARPYLDTVYNVGEYYVGEEKRNTINGVGDDVANCFAGLAEAKVLYGNIVDDIDNAVKSATEYIKAVLALDGVSGAELEIAVNNVQALKDAVNAAQYKDNNLYINIEGFVLTEGDEIHSMTDINVIFSGISTKLALAKSYCTQFISYVNTIENATNLAERYYHIRRALVVKANADATFEGVSEAIAILDAAVEAYKNDVSYANNAVSGGSAEDSSSAVRPRARARVARVVAFTGKYGKED